MRQLCFAIWPGLQHRPLISKKQGRPLYRKQVTYFSFNRMFCGVCVSVHAHTCEFVCTTFRRTSGKFIYYKLNLDEWKIFCCQYSRVWHPQKQEYKENIFWNAYAVQLLWVISKLKQYSFLPRTYIFHSVTLTFSLNVLYWLNFPFKNTC